MRSLIPASLPREWLVFGVIVVDLIGFGIVIPVLPFLSPALGGDEIDVALVIATYSLFAGAVGPFWGGLSDRIGRRRVLAICLFGGAISYVILGVASELWMVYAARGLGGIMAGSLPVATALMADLSRPERRAKAMGLVGTAFGLGLVLGPVIGGLLAGDGGSFVLAGTFAAGLSGLSALLAMVLLEPDNPASVPKQASSKAAPKQSIWTFLKASRSEWLVFQYVLHTFAVSASIYLSPLWLAAYLGWGPSEVGTLFGIVGVAMIIIQGGLIDWLTRTFGLLTVCAGGAAVFMVSLLAATAVAGEMPRAGVVIMAFIGATCCLPVLNTLTSSVVARDERGRMMGITALAASLGRVVGPLATGVCLKLFGYSATWVLVAMPVLGILIWTQVGGGRYRNIINPDDPASVESAP